MNILKKKTDEAMQPEPTLSEQIGDNTIEKGMPDLDNPQGKSNMGKVGLFLGLLFATGLVVAGLIMFTGGDDETEPQSKNEQTDMVTNTQSHNFNQDKDEIKQQESLEMAAASDVQAASEPQTVPTIESTPSTEPAQPVPMVEAPPPAAEPIREPLPPTAPPQIAEPIITSEQRQLAGNVLINTGDSDNLKDDEDFSEAAIHDDALRADADESESTQPKNHENALSSQLKPTQTASVRAKMSGNRDYLLAKGTNILCTLDTQIITTRAGFTRCMVSRDVYSANGKVLLLEKGTKIIGEQTAAVLQGQARVGILWNEATTPKGITVSLASPAAGQLGAAGVGARMKYHFWQRFGGAVMISLIGDLGDSYANRQKSGNGQNISFENSSQAAQDMATEALRNSINIPPTAYINHGTLINIMVARDVDFSDVYERVNPYAMP